MIDMREEPHRREVLKVFRAALREDRARTKLTKISELGIIEMTRQRMWPNLDRTFLKACPNCGGQGQVKTDESMAIEVMRTLMTRASHPDVHRLDVEVHSRVAEYLINRKRRPITELEEEYDVTVNIQTGVNVKPEHLRVRCLNEIGGEVTLLPAGDSYSRR